MIQSVFRAEGLPLDLAYMPIIESGFKTNALSKASAKGPWQFMRATALENGLKTRLVHRRALRSREGDRRGGEVSEDAAQDVRRRLAPGAGGLQRRAGPGAARDEARRHRRLLGAVARTRDTCRKETREYVPLILAAIIVARNPAQYGFERRCRRRRRLREGRRCRARSTCGASPSGPGTTIDEIQALNPELRRWTTPVGDARLRAQGAGRHRGAVRRPAGGGVARRARVAEVVHGAKRRTLRRSPASCSVSRTDLAEANYLSTQVDACAPARSSIIPRAPTTLLARRDRPPGAGRRSPSRSDQRRRRRCRRCAAVSHSDRR